MSEDKKSTETPIEFLKRGIAFRLKLRLIGSKRAVDTDKVDTGDADKDLLRVTKEILDSGEVKAIRNHDFETRAAIRRRALPSILGSGWYLLPIPSVNEIDEYVEARKVERSTLIDKLIEALPALKDRSKERLGHLWVEEQFPSPEVIRDKSTVASKYVTFDTPASIKGVSKAILEREVAKAADEAESYRNAAVSLLRKEVSEVVSVLADAFTPTVSGRKRTLRADTLKRVTEALDLFGSRNIAQDGELAKLVDQAKGLISGKEAKDVASDASLGQTFAEIKASVAALVVDGPSRTIDFEE